MSLFPLEEAEGRRIGCVEFIAPDEIKVTLDVDAPSNTALNTGDARPFPRINGYILVPADDGFVVGQIEWLGVESSQFPKRKGMQDYGLVDLPYPIRKISLNPVGTLKTTLEAESIGGHRFRFYRGVYSFPTIGDPAILPTNDQLRDIVESGDNRHVLIGHAPLAGNAEVKIDPDRLFGRHLAILGNTGSGKSCTVAGLVQWSLDSAKTSGQPNARFIILDPNGEYDRSFKNEKFKHQARIFRVGDSQNPLQVPLWFWNSAEWCSFTQASPKAQAPLLRQALRSIRNELDLSQPSIDIEIKRFLGNVLITIRHEKMQGSPWGKFPKPKAFLEMITKNRQSLEHYKSKISDNKLDQLIAAMTAYISPRSGANPNYMASVAEVDPIITQLETTYKAFGGVEHELLPRTEDTPTRFDGVMFINFLDSLAQNSGTETYVDYLLARIRTMLTDTLMNTITGDKNKISLADWLGDYIGKDQAENGCLTVIDLSLVPAEIVHLMTAVIARMTLEGLQRYRKQEEKSLPTVLIMEEAHTFVTRYNQDAENPTTASTCCKVFERIAREGRKFGLGLVLSSQRPSELSPTVLSQCNTFLLHRISNDRDQEQVSKLLPDNLRGLLRDLPTLPSQHAVLLGWASELPVLVRINDLEQDQRPRSDDPDFWAVWTGKDGEGNVVERKIDWKKIADDWQQKNGSLEEE